MDPIKMFKFGLIGCIGLIIDFGITWLCKEKLGWNRFLSNAIGFSAAVVNNYLLNSHYTFQKNDENPTLQFFQFAIIAVTGLGLNTMLLSLLLKKTSFNFYLSKLLVIAVIFVWNFTANNFYTFRH